MRVLDLKSNQEVDLPESEVAQRYLDGSVRVKEGDAIPVVSRTGEVGTVAPENLRDAISGGYEVTSQDAVRSAELEAVYGGAGQMALTGVEGVGRGLSLGLYDAAAHGIDPEYAKEAQRRAEINKGTAIAGEVGGALLPLLFSGGGSAGATGASLGARGVALAGRGARVATALPRAATALGRAAGAGAARVVGTGAKSALGRVAQKGVALGVEGAVESLPYAIGHGVSESVLHPEKTSQQILAGVGLETLAGGLAGGILGGAGQLGSEAYQRVARSVFGEGAHPALGEALVKASASLSGDDAANIRRLAMGDDAAGVFSESAKKNRQLAYFDASDVRDRVARDLTESLDDARAALSEIQDNYKGLNKIDALEQLLPKENRAAQITANRNHLTTVEDALAKLKDSKGVTFKSQLKDLHNVAKSQRGRFEASMRGRGQTVSGPEATGYASLDEMKRRLQGAIEASTASLIRSPKVSVQAHGRQTIEALEGLQEGIRQHLMDESLFGKAARAQIEVNDPWMKMIASNKNLSQRARLFEAYKAGEVGGYGNQWRANPERIARYLDSITDPRKDLVHKDLVSWIDEGERFSKAVGKYGSQGAFADDTLGAALKKYGEAAKRVRKGLLEAEDAIVLQNQAKALTTGGGLLDGGGSGMGVGAVAGMALDSVVPFAATTALGAARTGLGALSAPGRTLRQLASIERLASGVSTKLDGGVSKYLRAVKNASKAGAYASKKSVVRGAGMATRSDPKKDKKRAQKASREANRKTMAKVKERLELAKQNPEALKENLTKSTRHISSDAPKVTAAIHARALDAHAFLEAKLPKAPASDSPAGWKRSEVPDSELAKFAKYVSATEDPVGTLTRELEDGTLSRETMETLDALYPLLATDVRTTVVEEIGTMETPPPYTERVRLSILLGTPLDDSLKPARIAAYQKSYSMPEQPKSRPESGGAVSDIAKSYETTMNRLSV